MTTPQIQSLLFCNAVMKSCYPKRFENIKKIKRMRSGSCLLSLKSFVCSRWGLNILQLSFDSLNRLVKFSWSSKKKGISHCFHPPKNWLWMNRLIKSWICSVHNSLQFIAAEKPIWFGHPQRSHEEIRQHTMLCKAFLTLTQNQT